MILDGFRELERDQNRAFTHVQFTQRQHVPNSKELPEGQHLQNCDQNGRT
jgi:hypothetical protein